MRDLWTRIAQAPLALREKPSEIGVVHFAIVAGDGRKGPQQNTKRNYKDHLHMSDVRERAQRPSAMVARTLRTPHGPPHISMC